MYILYMFVYICIHLFMCIYVSMCSARPSHTWQDDPCGAPAPGGSMLPRTRSSAGQELWEEGCNSNSNSNSNRGGGREEQPWLPSGMCIHQPVTLKSESQEVRLTTEVGVMAGEGGAGDLFSRLSAHGWRYEPFSVCVNLFHPGHVLELVDSKTWTSHVRDVDLPADHATTRRILCLFQTENILINHNIWDLSL